MSTTRLLVITGFVLAFLAGLAVQFLARKRPESKIPQVGEVAAVVMRYEVGGLPIGRLALLGIWFWCGWHFLAR